MSRFYINVAHLNKHVFRTSDFQGFSEMKRAWDALVRKFTRRAGWSLTIIEHDTTGYEYDSLAEYREVKRREHQEWINEHEQKKARRR